MGQVSGPNSPPALSYSQTKVPNNARGTNTSAPSGYEYFCTTRVRILLLPIVEVTSSALEKNNEKRTRKIHYSILSQSCSKKKRNSLARISSRLRFDYFWHWSGRNFNLNLNLNNIKVHFWLRIHPASSPLCYWGKGGFSPRVFFFMDGNVGVCFAFQVVSFSGIHISQIPLAQQNEGNWGESRANLFWSVNRLAGRGFWLFLAKVHRRDTTPIWREVAHDSPGKVFLEYCCCMGIKTILFNQAEFPRWPLVLNRFPVYQRWQWVLTSKGSQQAFQWVGAV